MRRLTKSVPCRAGNPASYPKVPRIEGTEFYTPFRLSAGESAYFDSSMQHLFVSVSEEDARILSVSYDAKTGADQVTRFMHPDVKPVTADG